MIVPVGQDGTIEVRADIQTSSGIAYTAGTVDVMLPVGISNAQGQTSLKILGIPSVAVSTNGLTIQTVSLGVSQNTAFVNQNINPNAANVKIGSYVIQNPSTSTEPMRLTSFKIGLNLNNVSITNFQT